MRWTWNENKSVCMYILKIWELVILAWFAFIAAHPSRYKWNQLWHTPYQFPILLYVGYDINLTVWLSFYVIDIEVQLLSEFWAHTS